MIETFEANWTTCNSPSLHYYTSLLLIPHFSRLIVFVHYCFSTSTPCSPPQLSSLREDPLLSAPSPFIHQLAQPNRSTAPHIYPCNYHAPPAHAWSIGRHSTMATAKVAIQSPGLPMDAAPQALKITHSPDRKRKQRTPESPDRDIHETLGSRSYDYNSQSPPNRSHDARHDSAHSSNSASANGTTGDDGTSSRGGGGEETLTLRRREANRLAAQRFRSRKKGYQDSLEERIRILEDEKDVIARRLGQTHQHTPQEDGYYRRTEQYPPHSPDQTGDGDVRFASLESANRRLQDELRGVLEDNARLRDEVERWRKWEREQREPRPVEKPQQRGPALAPLDFGPMAPPSYTSSPYPSPHPPLERGHSYSHSYRSSSPGPRLPPLRLPGNGPHHTSPNGRPLLPRPESMERVNTLHNPRPQTSPAHRN